MRAVLDASAFVELVIERVTREQARSLAAAYGRGLVAPPLFWSEVTSALHRLATRRMLPTPDARRHHELLESSTITRSAPAGLRTRAWEIADRMGWSRTYDAEYCALAELEDVPLLTANARLVRSARGRLPYVIALADEVRRLA